MAKTSSRGPHVGEYFALEPLDRALLRGLQLAPRGQFRAFADVLGVSEQTVARRYRQMRDRGVVRVTTVINLEALGETTWLVRTACKPPSARQLAAALARRKNARWISIASGGAEVICKIRSRTASDYSQLLLARLLGNDLVAAVSTSMILNQFAGGLSASPWDLGDALNDDQLNRLTDMNETSPVDSRSSPADTKAPVLDSAD
jgi:DNA-binding Lrp family transcriptional regulator